MKPASQPSTDMPRMSRLLEPKPITFSKGTCVVQSEEPFVIVFSKNRRAVNAKSVLNFLKKNYPDIEEWVVTKGSRSTSATPKIKEKK